MQQGSEKGETMWDVAAGIIIAAVPLSAAWMGWAMNYGWLPFPESERKFSGVVSLVGLVSAGAIVYRAINGHFW